MTPDGNECVVCGNEAGLTAADAILSQKLRIIDLTNGEEE